MPEAAGAAGFALSLSTQLSHADMNAQQLIKRAMHCHQLGRFDEARLLYKDVIREQPQHFDALHLLGVLHIDQREYASGAQLIQTALAVNPNFAKAHFNLGLAYLQLRQYQSAATSFARAVALKPDYAEALNSCGNALVGLNRVQDAVTSYDRAIALRAAYPQALCNRGVALGNLGKYEEALNSFDRALTLNRDYPEARCQRANALANLNRRDEALAAYNEIVTDLPHYPDALAGRGGVLARFGQFDHALADYVRALEVNPQHLDALHNRGLTQMELRRYDDAIASFEAVLALKPDHFKTLNNLGLTFLRLRMLSAALQCFESALALNELPTTLFHKAETLLKLRRLPQAAAAFERALELEPESSAGYFSALYLTRLLACDWNDREAQTRKLHRHRVEDAAPVAPFILMCIETDSLAQLACARRLVELQGRRPAWPNDYSVPATGRARIAYLSANFNSHPVAYSIVELMEKHDRDRFEVVGISFGVDDGSAIRSRIAAACDQFIDVYGKTDSEVAALIQGMGVAVAVDLMGHTDDARPAILAQRPAPVQVNYLGYPGTTAAPYMDYLLADRFVISAQEIGSYDEHIVWLPDCYLPADSRCTIAERIPARAEEGLPAAGFVFCSFNAHYKIMPAMFDAWMNLLRRVAGSVLWLQGSNPPVQHNLRNEASARGIDPDRLVFATRADRLEDHLARHKLADLFLDTFPYNAHTTARDALWAGLPVLTYAGTTFPSRVAGSLLHTAQLPELVTSSLPEYEALAFRLATDAEFMRTIKRKVAGCRTTPLFDSSRLARHLDTAYTKMVETWRRGEPPSSFDV